MHLLRILAVLITLLFTPDIFGQAECKVLITSIQETYIGECKKGLAHGSGTATGIDTYTGKFKKGLPHGRGRYEWSTGEVYEGEWEKGNRSGIGKFIFFIHGKDSVMEGIWENNKYMGPVPVPPKILRKTNVDRITFQRMGDENKVGITLYQAGSVNREVEDLFLYGDSGIKYDAGTETGYENVTFPFYAKITYRTLNKLKTQQIDCYVEFEISQSGYWKVKIHN